MKHFIQAYKSKVLFSLLLILIGLGGAGHEELQGQKTIYVNASALPGGNGLTWATAYTNLSQAIDTSIYDPGDQVWVARGTYYPDSAYASIGLGLRNKTYVLRSGLKIFGGFDSGDVALADRDYITNTTILSGDIGTLGDDTDNSFSVVTGWYTDSTAVLDGFTIQDGRATDSRLLGFVNGGGVYCPDHPFTTGADIRNCIIKNNIATSNGGGAYIWHNNVSFTDCIFENNSANEGGGVFAGNDAEGAFDGCIFINNKSTSFGGALAIRGAHSVVLNSRVSFNSANQNGGGLFVDGIARPYIAGSILEGNTASNNGGGVYSANQAEPTILSTLISGNFAQNQGAGIYTQDVGTLVNVINATIAGNRAGSLGGGVYQFSAQVEVRNSIVYGNEHGANNDPFSQQLNGSNINTEYSLVAGISTPANSTNINTDPLFINPLSAAIAPIIGGDYAVSKYSPVINAGDSTDFPADSLDLDKDGDIVELYPWDVVQSFRIDNDTLDMGAYETLDFCRPLGSSKLLVSNSSLGFCEGDSVNILARRGYSSYKWELDSTVFFPLNLMVNLDSVAKVKILITDTTGCSALDSITTTVYALPNPAIIPSSPAVCQGDSVWLKTNTLHPLTAWSTMEVADSINIKTGGQYIVNIVDANGCPGDDTLNILQVPKPTLTLSPPDSVAICDGDSVIIKASGAFLGYLWNTNETTDSIIVKTSGIYHVIATGVNSCVVTDSIIVTVLPSPTVVISPDGPLTFCDGDSVKLDAGLADSYRWSNSEITQEITVKQSGIYGVTVKNQFGCPAEDSVEVVVNALPDATIFYATDTIFCAGDSILLSVANNYDKYRWSNGDTTFTTIVKNTALYTVTISDTNNCQSIGQINTVASPLPQPVIQAAGGSTSFCQGGQALLGLGSGNYPSVLWEDGETLPRTFALTGGYFNVEVTDALGCKGEDSILITVFPNPVPTITPGGNVAICDGDTLSLDAGLYASYFWFHGNTRLVGESSQVLKTDSAGTYSVRVVDSNNCSGIDLVVVSVNPKPVLNAIIPNGPTTFCDGDSVELDAQPFAAYAWSSGESVQKITVKRSGNYRAIVANIFRCTDTAFIDVTVNPVPVAKITPLGSTTICFGDSLRLDGGVHDKYKWSTNDTTRFITVKVGGTFGLEVTNTFGCSAIDSITTLLGPVLNPNITLSGSSTLCQGDTLILDAGVFPSYNWSTGESSQTIKVARGDTFWVQVGVPIGCTGSDTVIVDLVNNPIPSILALGPTTFCDGDSVVLDADAYDGYLWSTGDTTRFITVDSAGIFEVLVTDDNLCQGLTSVSTQVNPTPVASISPSGATTFCEGDSVVLDGGLHFSYLWSNGENGRFTTIKASDTVGLKVTNALGCSDTDSIIIEVFSNPQATIIASNTTIFCQGDSVVLDVGNFASIAWSQDGIQIDTVRAIIARDDAEYTVLVTDTNGCSGEDTIFIVVNPLPQPVINVLSHASPDFCEGEQIFLEVGTFNGIMWSTGDITPVISVDTSQEVTVEVTDANNCKASDTLDVTAHPVPQPDIMAAPGVNICKGDTAILDAGGYNFYRWNNSLTDTLQILKVDTSGRYFVRVLNDFCLGYDSIDIVVSDNPILTLSPDTLTETCENTPITISSSTPSKYDWSTGDTTQSITVSTSDVYRLTVTEPSGCFTTDSVEVIAFSVPVPVIKASGLTTFCEGDSVKLNLNKDYVSYLWDNEIKSPMFSSNEAGIHFVRVSDNNGCIDSLAFELVEKLSTKVEIIGDSTICFG
ncbi:MAG: hypothetical protein AB8F95_16330, partial [Bacteroidia bacterium]